MSNELLREARRALQNHADAVTYDSVEDEVGRRVCCGVTSYKPHENDCEITTTIARIDAHLASGGWIECSESGAKRNAAMIPYENLDMHLCTERNGKWYARQPLPSLPKETK